MTNEDAYRDDPPEDGRGKNSGGKWAEMLMPARGVPGEWFRVPGQHASNTATSIKQGRLKGIAPGEFEVTTRVAENDRRKVWVRYVGRS